LFGLIELTTYGLKGLCAYFYHAEKLRGRKQDIYPTNDRKGIIIEALKINAALT